VDKGVGLAMLRTKLGIDRMHVIAFGDNENDLEMLEGAGIGVAMGNSKQYVKDAANEVTGDNDHDGVAEFLERFFGL
jgi:hydroxymethylpyrimidine pyrophosphatase-like HAD family hydrolase